MELKVGKAAGVDAVPAEWIKAEAHFWTPILAKLFSAINDSGIFPEAWKESLIVPIHKKGDKLTPGNYRPISLLSIVGKLYAKTLLHRVNSWIEQHDILGPEQIGFRRNKATLDHCLVLYHLAHKYTSSQKSKLYVAFLDLKGAFDSVDRDLLWAKLAYQGMEPKLLNLIMGLYKETKCRVRISQCGQLSREFPTNRGVKQGCILAPTLFNLFLNDLAPTLSKVEGHPPKLGDLRVPLLLYADDAILLSQSRIGLKRLIQQSLSFFSSNKLTLNFDKSKIMVFAKVWKPMRWTFGQSEIEQVKSFRYLGLLFAYNLSWVSQRNAVRLAASLSAQAIAHFSFNKGGACIPAALRIFSAKTINQIMYGIPIWIQAFNHSIEQVQASFLRKIFGLPNCTAYAVLCLESGQYKLETLAWVRASKFWLKIFYTPDKNSLITHLLSDSYFSASHWLAKISEIGLEPDLIGSVPLNEAYKIIKQNFLDFYTVALLREANKFCSPLYHQISTHPGRIPTYLHVIEDHRERRAMSLARCNVLPSEVLWGRYKGIAYAERCCPCSQGVVESLDHLIFHCPRHQWSRQRYLLPLMNMFPQHYDEWNIQLLFAKQEVEFISQLARFLACIIKTNLARI